MAAYLRAFQHTDTIVVHDRLGTTFLPDAIFTVHAKVCSSGIGLQLSTGMGSYHQPVLETHTSEVDPRFIVY